jgi:hypothetical protein
MIQIDHFYSFFIFILIMSEKNSKKKHLSNTNINIDLIYELFKEIDPNLKHNQVN